MRFILTADWHIRATKPRCRKDENWMETQRNALNQIFEIATIRHTWIAKKHGSAS